MFRYIFIYGVMAFSSQANFGQNFMYHSFKWVNTYVNHFPYELRTSIECFSSISLVLMHRK
jgi:hypothetical protein